MTDLIIKPFTPATLQQPVNAAARGEVRNRQGNKPASTHEAPTAEQKSKSAARSAQASILVVDDTVGNLTLLGGLLKDEYRVMLAKDGPRALTICQSDNPPDLILLDIMMPEMDGYEVLKRLRSHPTSEHIPVVFVSALSEQQNVLRGFEGGAIDYIAKPVQADLLKLRVRNLINYVGLMKNLQADYDNMLENQRLREQVEGMMRHDLKGPLAAIHSLAEQLVQSKDAANLAKQTGVDIAQLAIQGINQINQSLELVKIEAGIYQLDAKTFSMLEVVQTIFNAARNSFKDKQLMYFLDPGSDEQHPELEVLGDRTLSFSMLFNVIKNACETAPARTRVSARVVRLEKCVEISVENVGAVPMSVRERFWDKFATHGKSQGTGLGTYSTKLLAQAQNAEVYMQTDDDSNLTRITFEFPFANQSE